MIASPFLIGDIFPRAVWLRFPDKKRPRCQARLFPLSWKTCSKLHAAVRQNLKGAAKVDFHGPHKSPRVGHAGHLPGSVHGQLGKADIHGRDGQVCTGDIAQRGSARQIRPVAVKLYRHFRHAAYLPEDGSGEGVGGVALIGVVLENNAATQHRELVLVGVLPVGGMDGVGVVGRDQKTGGDSRPVILPGEPRTLPDAGQDIRQEGRVRPLAGVAAHFFIVEDAQNRHALTFPGCQESPGAGKDALEIVQPGSGDELLLNPQQRSGRPGVEEQFRGEDGLLRHTRLPGDEGAEAPGFRSHSQQGRKIHGGIQGGTLVDFPVHVDGHAGDHQKIPVYLYQPGLNAALCLHGDAPCHGEGAVHPGPPDAAAVGLHTQPHGTAGGGQLCVFPQLQGGGVAVPCGDEESPGPSVRQPEGNQGGVSPHGKVFPSGGKGPGPGLRQKRVARLPKRAGQGIHGVVAAGTLLEKVQQLPGKGLILHGGTSCNRVFFAHQYTTSSGGVKHGPLKEGTPVC